MVRRSPLAPALPGALSVPLHTPMSGPRYHLLAQFIPPSHNIIQCRSVCWERHTHPTTKRTLLRRRCAPLRCIHLPAGSCTLQPAWAGWLHLRLLPPPLVSLAGWQPQLCEWRACRACGVCPAYVACTQLLCTLWSAPQVSAVWAYQARYRVPLSKAVAGDWVLLEGVDATSECNSVQCYFTLL